MTESLIVADNLREKNVENSLVYRDSDSDLNDIGNFVQGGEENFSANNIDKLNDTLVFSVTNPTTVTRNVNLFGWTNSLFSPIPPNPPPSILNPITIVGTDARDTEYCPINNFLYICDFLGNAINVFDCSTSTLVVSIPLAPGYLPNSIAYNPVSNEMYICSSALFDITRISCATNAIVGLVIVPVAVVNAFGIIYNSVKNSMYVSVGAVGALQEINCITNVIGAPFFPGIVTFSRFGIRTTIGAAGRLYVSDAATNNILVVNCATNLAVAVIVVPFLGASAISFCPVNNLIYVCYSVSDIVQTINTNTNVPGVVIPVAGGSTPNGIAYNSLNNLLYVIQPGIPSGGFSVINPVTNTVILGPTAIGFGGFNTDVVYNSVDNSIWFSGVGVFGQVASFTPVIPPSAVVTISGGYTLGDLFNDLQGKPLALKGMKIIVQSLTQLFNNITVDYFSIYGKKNETQFQPSNYISPTNRNSLMIDAADFEIEVDGNTDVTFDIEPLSSLIIIFTINKAVDNTVPLFEDITKDWGAGTDKRTNIRWTGSPMADMILQQEADKILSESGYNSIAQYAFYPRETGNPVVDIALLNGFD